MTSALALKRERQSPLGPGQAAGAQEQRAAEDLLATNMDSFDGPPRLARLVHRIFPREATHQIRQEFEQGNLLPPYMSLTLPRPKGRTLPIEMSTAPLRGREGKDLGVLGAFRDVTVLRDLEKQLRRSDRLAPLGTLAAGLAHEIKNPLAALRTFTRFRTIRPCHPTPPTHEHPVCDTTWSR